MTEGLYQKHRPNRIGLVFGQESAVTILQKFIKSKNIPHCILFSGPSGTGKTTMARILAAELGTPEGHPAYSQINCGECDPINTIRDLGHKARTPPLFGDQWVWIMDEYQAFSRATFSQQAMLSMMEDSQYAYFFLCSTDPAKISAAIRNRCTEIKLSPVDPNSLRFLLNSIISSEGKTVSKEAVDKLVQIGDGSPRRAIVALEKIIDLRSKDQVKMLEKEGIGEYVHLPRLLFDNRVRWDEVKVALEKLKGEDPEKIRRGVLAYAQAILLKSAHPRAFAMIQIFRDNLYDSGFAGLVANSYELVTAKR